MKTVAVNVSLGIKRSLAWLVAIAILPIIAFSVVTAWQLVDHQKATVTTELAGISHALSVAVDGALRDHVVDLEVLAADVSLDSGDLTAFHERARRMVAAQPTWRGIALVDPATKTIRASSLPLASPLPQSVVPAGIDTAARERKSLVFGVFAQGNLLREPGIMLIAPVIRDGRVPYVLTAVLGVSGLNGVLAAQHLPAAWTAAILDDHLILAGRSRSPEVFVGKPATPSLAEHITGADSGMFDALNQEGDKVTTVFSRSPLTGWSVAIGIPAAEVEGPVRRKIAMVTLAGTALVLLALLLAGIAGRRIIVNRQIYEDALKAGERRYRNLFTGATAAMLLIDPQTGTVVDANAAAAEFYGTDIERLKTMLIWDINVGSAEDIAAEMALADQEGRKHSHFRHRLANGDIREVEVHSGPLDIDGRALRFAIIHDITDRRAAEQAIRDLGSRLQDILAAASEVAIIATDIHGTVTLFNRGAERMLGYGAAEVVGLMTPAAFHLPEEMRDRLAELTGDIGPPLNPFDVFVAKARIDGHELREWTYRRRDGTCLAVSLAVTPVRSEDGTITGYLGVATDISERKRAEAQLRDSEERFRTLVEGTADWAWETDANHCFSWFSATIDESALNPRETMLGKRRWDLASHQSDIDATRWQAHLEDLSARRSFRDFRYWIRARGGEDRWVSASGTPRFDDHGTFLGYRGSSSDVTAEATIALRLRMLSTVVEQSPVSVVITDPKGTIEYVNSHFTAVTGYDAAEVIGVNPRILASGETPPELYREMWMTISAGRRWAGELRNRRKDGTPHWEMVVIAPVKNDLGEIAHYVASHDLRQPLRMVTSYLGLIEKRLGSLLADDIKTFLDYAVDGAKRMDRLILDLLEYSRTGKTGQWVMVPLADAVADAQANLTVAILETDAEILVDRTLPTIKGSPTELVRLFQNLIGNALKYREADRRPVVVIGCRRKGGNWLISVKDNGIGIAPEHHERAFGIFQRLVPQDAYEGSGIGLAVCKKIVEHHGGRIWIESDVGRGSSFLMTFPAAPAIPSTEAGLVMDGISA